jgi:hypothetical protein
MKYLTHTHTRTPLLMVIFFLSILVISCENNFNEIKSDETQNTLSDKIELTQGNTVKIESKSVLKSIFKDYQENVEGQNVFNAEIRVLRGKGFKPLTPIFNENQTEEIQNYVLSKKKRIANRNREFGVVSKSVSTSEDEIDLDDDLIVDPVLSGLLNEDREIIVADSLYKYTETGLYFCLVKDKQKLYDYLNKLTPSSKREQIAKIASRVAPCEQAMQKTASKMIQEQEVTNVGDGISRFVPAKDCGGVNIYNPPAPVVVVSPVVVPTPKLIKSNLEISRIEKQGFFEKIFGESEVDTEDFGDGRRIKIKFWNQNYFIFSSLGCSAKFQKREKLLGVSYWEKSYATKIELGVNDVSYDYNFNVPVYNAAKYNYENFFIEINGVKYAGSGKQIIDFPSGSTNFPFSEPAPEQLVVHIYRKDLLEINYDANKIYNQAVDLAVKQAFRQIVSYNPALNVVATKVENGDIPYKVIAVDPLSNKATISTQGLKWTYNDDHEITHYFDFNFLLTYKSNYANAGDYLQGLKGSTKYTALRADIYGAALHNNVWKGRRLILGN